MLREIIEVYQKQYELYEEVYDKLKVFDKDNIDILSYQNELQNIDFTLDNIKTLNERAEQLKIIYVTKNHFDDFTGKNIEKVETRENYTKLKETIDKLTNKIVSTKKLQDSIIKRIKYEMDVTRQLLNEITDKKNAAQAYIKQDKSDKSIYIDRKK